MIQINLLPEERRPAEKTPLPRFLVYLGGLLGFALAALILVKLYVDLGREKQKRTNYIVTINSQQKTIDKINELRREIAGLKTRKTEIQRLFKDRRRWGPILYMLHDDTVLPRHVWFEQMELKQGVARSRGPKAPDELVITAYARGSALVARTQARNEFAHNIAKSKIYEADFQGEVTWPEIGRMKEMRVQGEGAPQDVPKEALAFTMNLKVKGEPLPTRAKP